MLLHPGSGGRPRHDGPPPRISRATLARSAFSTPVVVRHDSSIDLRASLHAKPSTTEIRRHPSVSFLSPDAMEEHVACASDDGKSVVSHEGSEEVFGIDRRSRKKKKTPKIITSYAIAHPAPTIRQKHEFMALRPQLLLQLQRVSAATRPVPMIDVLPAAVFAPRLAKRFPMVFKVLGRIGLGPNDILCVRSEDYGTSDHHSSGSDSDDDGWASRDIEAVICQTKKSDASKGGQVEIVFSSGSQWTAVPISAGIYEFTSVDDHGLKTTARWVRRTFQRSTSDMKDKAPTTPKKETKFNFSILDPTTRRHPVIASLTSNSLDIPDTYSLLSSSHQKKNSVETIASTETEPTSSAAEKSTVHVSETLRKLIQITSVWVTLRQGWSPYFKYDDSPSTNTRPVPSTTPPPFSTFRRGRSVSLDHKAPRHHRASTDLPDSPRGSFSSASGLSRRLKRKSTGSKPTRPTPSPAASPEPRRSTSTGTAFMAKIAAKRASHAAPPSTLASTSDHDSLASDTTPPRRAATVPAPPGRAARNSSLGVTNASSSSLGRLRTRVSSPSPLGAIYSQGNSDRESDDVFVTEDGERASPLPPSHGSVPESAEEAGLGRGRSLVATAPPPLPVVSSAYLPPGTAESSRTRRKTRKAAAAEKRSPWGKFTSLFRKNH